MRYSRQFLVLVTMWTAVPVLGDTSLRLEGTVPDGVPKNIPVPVVVQIPTEFAKYPSLEGHIAVNGTPVDETILQTEPADDSSDTPPRAWFLFSLRPAQTGKSIRLTIVPHSNGVSRECYLIRYTDPAVEITTVDGKPVLSYRHGKPDPALKYPMTSYIHPLIGLDGEVLTDCSPPDHLHHRGLFWAWVRTERGGQDAGEWWQPRDMVLEAKHLAITDGPLFARFAAHHDYIYQPAATRTDVSGVEPGTRLFDESVVCRVFQTTSSGRAIDVDLTLTALQDGLRIGGQTQLNKGYGGFTLRFSTTQEGQAVQPRIIADGRTVDQDTVNHLKALWVDWTGFFLGPDRNRLAHRSGGAIFVHSSHPPLPNSAPEWITRAYGPINVAYPGLNMVEIPKNNPLRLRYRVWLHRGDAIQAGVEGQYRAYTSDWKWKTEP